MAGKKATIASADTRINAFQVQKSSYGIPIPVLLGGTNRVAASLLWLGDFEAIATQTQQSSGGKGGGGVKQSNTTYSYKSAVLMGICEGPIEAVTGVLRDKSVFRTGSQTALAQAGLSAKLGTPGQSVWPYLTTNHPGQAIGYSEVAYAYAADYDLADSGSLQNHTFEVKSPIYVPLKLDANPRDLVENFLTNESYGVPLWTMALIGDLDDYETYCLANNLLLSPLLDTQRQASEILEEMVKASNSEIVWSEGVLKIRPYGTETTTGNGVTWTPDLTPVYELGAGDFLVDDDAEEPIASTVKRVEDAYNYVQIEFLNRARDYAVQTMPAWDQAAIEEFGERKENPVRLHSICDAEVAKQVAELRKNRLCYVRERFSFRLPWTFSLLEGMDLVTITWAPLGVDHQLVRIIELNEDDDGDFDVLAEEVAIGIADAPVYGSQNPTGYAANYNAPPGDVEPPVLFTPPSTLTEGRLELWGAIAGLNPDWGGCEVWVSLDGDTYQRQATQNGRTRYGITTTAITVNTSPDETNVLGIDVTASQAEILPATTNEALAAATLCYVDGELLAYRDATLTASYEYDLEYLVRGLNGSAISAHASGVPFVRIDETIVKVAFLPEQTGETVYVKIRSFNRFGRALQDLADLDPYTAVLTPPGAFPDAVTALVRANPSTEANIVLTWSIAARALRYKVFIYSPDGATFYRSIVVTATTYTYAATEQTADGATGGCLIIVVASNDSGDASGTGYNSTGGAGGGGGGPQPAAVTGAYADSPDFNSFLVTCNPSSDPDVEGYVLYMGGSGFTPTGGGVATSAYPYLEVYSSQGFKHGRVAAYNSDWDGTPADLNFSEQVSAYVSDYRESCPSPETLILLADGTEVRADSITAGMHVRTRHETTREWMNCCVMGAIPGKGRRWTAVFSNGRTLVASLGHRIGLPGGAFVSIENLIPGLAVDGLEETTVVSIEESGKGPVVHLTVATAHTYVAAGILSHNIKYLP